MTHKPFIVFGTRPEYLKLKPLALMFHTLRIDFQFVHILQHEDLHVDTLLQAYLLTIPLHTMNNISRLTQLATSIPIALENYLSSASVIIVQGDTATAFYSALSAFHHKIPIYHIEAGLRTYDLLNPYPEEAYRCMISQIATYHLCPDSNAENNVCKATNSKNIFTVGNTILDLVKSYGFSVSLGKKIPITIHRRENWPQLSTILKHCVQLAKDLASYEFEWILHPNPALQKECLACLESMTVPSNFRLQQPMDHPSLCKILSDCYCVITDSGGLQEEASFLGKTCFVMRQVTERSALDKPYIYMVASPDHLIPIFKQTNIQLLDACYSYGRGASCEAIVAIMKSNGHI